MIHCWAERWRADGYANELDAAIAEIERRWPNGVPAELVKDDYLGHYGIASDYVTETCMLADGHAGPHAFEDISDWRITFLPAEVRQ